MASSHEKEATVSTATGATGSSLRYLLTVFRDILRQRAIFRSFSLRLLEKVAHITGNMVAQIKEISVAQFEEIRQFCILN